MVRKMILSMGRILADVGQNPQVAVKRKGMSVIYPHHEEIQ